MLGRHRRTTPLLRCHQKDRQKHIQICALRTMPKTIHDCWFAIIFTTETDAKEVRKLAVSTDNRPPTSPARTTSLARPPSPASSGYVRSFRLLATLSAAPCLVAKPALAVPSPRNALTNVTSIASWAPGNMNVDFPTIFEGFVHM